MTSDAASTQPRKRAWKRLIVALACVVAVVTVVLLATPPKPEPVKVWFVRATNEAGERKLVFEGTNGIPATIAFFAAAFAGDMHHRNATNMLATLYDAYSTNVTAGGHLYFTLQVRGKGVPYYIMWKFQPRYPPITRLEALRWDCFYFLRGHGMVALANRIVPRPEVRFIPSTEIKE